MVGPDDSPVPADRYAVSEPIINIYGIQIAGEELLRLRPGASGIPLEDVRRSRIAAVLIVKVGPDDSPVPADRYAASELISSIYGIQITGEELLFLRPGVSGIPLEDERRSRIAAVLIVPVGPDDNPVPADRYGGSETIFRIYGIRIAGEELCEQSRRLRLSYRRRDDSRIAA